MIDLNFYKVNPQLSLPTATVLRESYFFSTFPTLTSAEALFICFNFERILSRLVSRKQGRFYANSSDFTQTGVVHANLVRSLNF